MKKLILILSLIFCLVISGTALAYEKVDISGVNFDTDVIFRAKIVEFLEQLNFTTLAITDDLGNGRQIHWQFTATSIEGGEQLQGIQLRSSWAGISNAPLAGITGIEIKARAADESITSILGQARAIVGNVDCKKATFNKGYAFEAAIDVYAGGTIGEAIGFRAFLNNSGTVTDGYAFYVDAESGYPWEYGLYIEAGMATTGIYIGGDGTTGIVFAGDYVSHVLDFSDVTQAAGDISLIRAGNYTTGEELDVAGEDQYGMLRFYLSTDDDGTSYNRGIFVCLKTAGTKNIFPISGLAEVLADDIGPAKAQAAQFIAGLHEDGSKLSAPGEVACPGMFGAWLKVYSVVDSIAASGSMVAPVWIDNQMCGTVSGEEYGIFATTGGTRPDGFIGFETSSSGYDQFIYADTSFDAGAGTCFETSAGPASQTARIKVWYDSSQYYILLYE